MALRAQATVFLAATAMSLHSEAAVPTDLPRLIECRAAIADYTQLATKLGSNGDGSTLGWVKIKQSNSFIAEYQLPKPIAVFGGYKTRRIAFSASGVLAILEQSQTTPKALADKLHLEPVAVGTNRVIFAKVIKDDSDEAVSVIIRLNASTIDSHPGKTFAGCEYQVSVK